MAISIEMASGGWVAKGTETPEAQNKDDESRFCCDVESSSAFLIHLGNRACDYTASTSAPIASCGV